MIGSYFKAEEVNMPRTINKYALQIYIQCVYYACCHTRKAIIDKHFLHVLVQEQKTIKENLLKILLW